MCQKVCVSVPMEAQYDALADHQALQCVLGCVVINLLHSLALTQRTFSPVLTCKEQILSSLTQPYIRIKSA